MKFLLPNNYFYQLLFTACVVVPYMDNYELTFLVWLGAVFLSFSRTLSLSILKQVSVFILILIVALFVMFKNDYKNYYIIRDIAYLLKPILGLLIGYQICKKLRNNLFELIVNAGLVMAVYHIMSLIAAVVIYKAHSVNDIRFHAGYFSDYEIFCLIILLFSKKFDLQFSSKKIRYYLIIIGFSSVMYLARTNFIQFVILFIAMKGYLVISKRSITVFIIMLLVSLIGYSAVLYINPKRNGQGIEAFLYKVKIAPMEPFKTKINRGDYKEFNDNYRSYENILTVEQVSRDGFSNVVFGKGLGSKVDLKQEVFLGDMKLRYISVLHNGFMTVFLKSGLLGVFLLCGSIFLLVSRTKSSIEQVNNINTLLLGTSIFLIVSYWVFMGFYFRADTKSILVGALICFREIKTKLSTKEFS